VAATHCSTSSGGGVIGCWSVIKLLQCAANSMPMLLKLSNGTGFIWRAQYCCGKLGLLFQARRLGASGGAQILGPLQPELELSIGPLTARLQLLVSAPAGGLLCYVAFIKPCVFIVFSAFHPLSHQLRRWGDRVVVSCHKLEKQTRITLFSPLIRLFLLLGKRLPR